MSRFWRWLNGTLRVRHETYDTEQKWVVYGYFVPDWVTRVLGRTSVRVECLVCGQREYPTLRLPRFGDVPKPSGGQHQERVRFKREHAHPRRAKSPFLWARPLRNPAALGLK